MVNGWHHSQHTAYSGTQYDPIWVNALSARHFITSTKFSIFPIMRSKPKNVRVCITSSHAHSIAIYIRNRLFFFFYCRHHYRVWVRECVSVRARFQAASFRLNFSAINSFLCQQKAAFRVFFCCATCIVLYASGYIKKLGAPTYKSTCACAFVIICFGAFFTRPCHFSSLSPHTNTQTHDYDGK